MSNTIMPPRESLLGGPPCHCSVSAGLFSNTELCRLTGLLLLMTRGNFLHTKKASGVL